MINFENQVKKTLCFAIVSSLLLASASAIAQKAEQNFVDNQVLVKFKTGANFASSAGKNNAMKALRLKQRKKFTAIKQLELLDIPKGSTVTDTIRKLEGHAEIEYAEPNYIYSTNSVTPTDYYFDLLWGLNNRGQNGGTSGIDIGATDAWVLSTGDSSQVVAVIDTGVDYTHPDLRANMWVNSAEIPGNGVDDDGNGFIDDIHGINAINRTGDPMDDNDHGTHVAGTIGAIGDNNIGVTGVNWQVKIAACKFLGSDNYGSTSDALTCLDYFYNLKQAGVNIIASNNSWGGGGDSRALQDAIRQQENAGILFIASAGNDALDTDVEPQYPASYDNNNIISVAAIDRNGQLASFSNIGNTSVDIAAPGVDIFSTVRSGYSTFSGTSMAAPHVSGVVALLASYLPHLTAPEIKTHVLAGSKNYSTLTNKTLTGSYLSAAEENGLGALTCDNTKQKIFSPELVSVGDVVNISALSIDCYGSASDVVANVSDGSVLTLQDNGLDTDIKANDFIFSATWTPQKVGVYEIEISGEQSTIEVLPGFPQAVEVNEVYRTLNDPIALDLFDDSKATIALPFELTIGTTKLNELDIGSNGCLGLLPENGCLYGNEELPSVSAGTTVVLPFWDDLDPGIGGNIQWQVMGNAPNRELVVEWQNIRPFATAAELPGYSFQVVFTEGTDDILINYLEVESGTFNDNAASATIGVQLSDKIASQYSYDLPEIVNGMSLHWEGYTIENEAEPTVISFEGFESGWGQYKSNGENAMLYTGNTYAWGGNNAVNIQANTGFTSTFQLVKGLDVSRYDEITFEFGFYAKSLEPGESFQLRYFDGSNWRTLNTWTVNTDFKNDKFHRGTYTISRDDYNFPKNMNIKFKSTASWIWDDVYIDAIKILAR